MIPGQLMVVRQVLLLLVIAEGAGYWVWRFSGRPKDQPAPVYIWLGAAGFCLSALLLQSLVYLGLPLRITAWPAFAASGAGLLLALGERGFRPLKFSADGGLYALVFATSFLGQGVGLLAVGPSGYFGSGHYDQANYVVTAEFLRSEKFSSRAEDLGYRPWKLKALDLKEQRITQCVILGELAELDRSSAQECYGSVSVFFVALMGVVTVAWLRNSGLSRTAAGWVGIGAALTPAITRVQLDGFFSQAATLFVYPALAGLLSGAEPPTNRTKFCAAVFLAFLLGSYSEIAVFGGSLVAALVIAQGAPWRARVFDVSTICGGALLLNPGYLERLANFLVGQAMFGSRPGTLAALFPESGTWIGWGRMFADLPWRNGVIGVGVLVGILGAWGAISGDPIRRRQRMIVVGVALLPLLVLRMIPDFPRYPFAKLAIHFIPIWLGAAMLGLVRVSGFSVAARRFIGICGALGTVAAFGTAMPFQLEVVHPAGRLKAFSSEILLQSRREAKSDPARAYLVAHRDPLMALWLCYFGRANNVVLETRTIGDRVAPTETYSFRRWSAPLGELWWLDPEVGGRVLNYEPTPELVVEGAADGAPGQPGGVFRVKNSLDFVFRRPLTGPATRHVWLDFVAVPVLSNEVCDLVLESPEHDVQKTTLRGASWQRWRVLLGPGENRYRLRILRPPASAGNDQEVVVKLLSVEVAEEVLPSDPQPSADSGTI
jgi:hypothetical protein